MRLALIGVVVGAALIVVALTAMTGGARSTALVGGLAVLGVAVINLAVQWHFRGRTVRVDAREHYWGQKRQPK